jgi:hypothetical protein
LKDVKEIIQDHRWVHGGDFNVILSLAEKRGGNHRLEKDREDFKEFIEASFLVDLENINSEFTWSHRHSGS